MTDKGNRDHVPSQHYFAPSLRKQFNLSGLLTLRTHPACNAAYRVDEEYFGATAGALAPDSPAGQALMRDLFNRYRRGSMVGLVQNVVGGFSTQVNGIALPPNLLALKVQGERIQRVLWKIVRGLFYHHYGTVLREAAPRYIELVEPAAPIPEMFNAVLATKSLGLYQGIFAYKNTIYRSASQGIAQDVWAMCFWDRVIAVVAFNVDPTRLPERVPLLIEVDPGPPPIEERRSA